MAWNAARQLGRGSEAVADVGPGACSWPLGAEYRWQGGFMGVSGVATRPPERQS
jgi:hypothetical protein